MCVENREGSVRLKTWIVKSDYGRDHKRMPEGWHRQRKAVSNPLIVYQRTHAAPSFDAVDG